MARANVPKFGNWENGVNDVPYTVYFDKARKNKVGGKMINPNDPQENPGMFAHLEPPPPTPPPKSSTGRGSVRPTPDQRDADYSHFSNSSSARSERGRGQRPPARPSAGSDQSFERSPLHPQYQARVMGQGSGSPALDGRSHDSSRGTPARSRLRPVVRGDESPEKAAAVPKFGVWDENENYTVKFNQVRDQKNSSGARSTPKHISFEDQHRRLSNEPKVQQRCCFPW